MMGAATLALTFFSAGAIYGAAAHRQTWFPFSIVKALRETRPSVDIPNHPDYKWAVDFLSLFASPAQIGMVGDSLTAMARWESIFPNHHVANLGVGWDNTAGILKRIGTIEGRGLRVIFLMVGTNDLDDSSDVEAVAARYRAIIRRLGASAEVIVQSTLYVDRRWAEKNRRIERLNERLSEICEDEGCTFVNLNEYLAPDGYILPSMTIDGTHLTPDAYVLWADAIRPMLHQGS